MIENRRRTVLSIAGATAVGAMLLPADALPQASPLEATGFIVMTEQSGGTTEALTGTGISSIAGGGWSMRDTGGGRFELVPSTATTHEGAGGTRPRLTAGVAWEQAHRFSQQPGVRYVEPTFAVPGNHGEGAAPDRYCPPCQPDAERVTTCHNPIASALADPEWHLRQQHGANVEEAWKLFDAAQVAPGSGVVIAHPDTGFRRHPEIWSPGPRTNGVMPELGWNYLTSKGWDPNDLDSGPFDLLLGGFLRNPGHGTKTSSVIVSPRGSQYAGGSDRWVSGVAPGAQLMPLRVAEGVVLFPGDLGQVKIDVKNLAQAIRDASGPSRERAKAQAQVISISLGGLPTTRDLAEAVAYAESRGVIVIAAAGNMLPDRRVVFPAGFESVVAVAASNVKDEPWACSSKGSKVEITAPGETVWTAQSRPGQECLQAGDGTSFATSMTAGIAALWLSYPNAEHQRELALLKGSARLPQAFKRVLRGSGRPLAKPLTGYGAGIINAVTVLTTPVQTPAPLQALSAGHFGCVGKEGPAFDALGSVFRDVPDGATRIRSLLKGLTRELCNAPELADELSFWITTDAAAGQAVQKLATTPSAKASAFNTARARLLSLDLSASLRAALGGLP